MDPDEPPGDPLMPPAAGRGDARPSNARPSNARPPDARPSGGRPSAEGAFGERPNPGAAAAGPEDGTGGSGAPAGRWARLAGGLRLAAGLLSVWPAGAPHADRATAGRAMLLAPLVGLLLGGAAAAVQFAAGLLLSPPLAAALAIGSLALLTRALHLDGLADLADGLGSGRPAAGALEIMKRSDIGPFGVVTLVFTLLIQVAAAAEAGPPALVAACVTGRLAVTWACTPGVPAARPGGLGALVTGTVRPGAAGVATASALAGAVLLGLAAGGPLRFPLAVAGGLAAAWALRGHAVRRLGGVTGDVLGALVEAATAAALLVCAA
ncbi:hypothetical protein Sru01_10090 [Sphaerisporangium rufum]|uniref:Adenosylcobinamide-GDP ribazoletransferase n=1 Tax=Sphaerisporangium rufum TaxID=1381558 RepID=A0A919R2W3_9ACTN|nr:adenosylcobinamide-GDP ribazoletransferase [Sphaerisporangium rufum]GII76027.1 hypothetical protein Sru01_10090 [Sphaerisporangium rufum]